jgi:putative membrane protein
MFVLSTITECLLEQKTPSLLCFHLNGPPSFLSVAWSWEPGIVLPLALLLVLYLTGSYRRGNWRSLQWRHISFAAAWLTLFFALASPVHELGEQLFSAHMLQHEILILVFAPLFSASQPSGTFLWAFAPRSRQQIGGWIRKVEQSWPIRMAARPLMAWLLEAVSLWVWHIPLLYQATLRSGWIHAAQHLSFFLTAVLFWSALYGMGRSATSYGTATFYVFGTAIHCGALGALLTFSSVLWYPAYNETTWRWGLTPLQDQQLGGLIMWVPSGVVFIIIGLVLFAKWIAESDRRMKLTHLHAFVQQQEAGHE